jgi:pantoate--beta-alanine ligase
MQQVASEIRSGIEGGNALREGRHELEREGFVVDYLELRNAETLAKVADIKGEPLRMLAAARLGSTRLIDNIAV